MPSDSNPDLQQFGERLISAVRDRSIAACDRLVSGAMVGPDAERWRSHLHEHEARQAIEALIPDIVDQTLFELLNAVDNGELPLGWRRADGSLVELSEFGFGETAGWLMGSPGWRHQYSQQRFFDPLAGLRLSLEPEPPKKK